MTNQHLMLDFEVDRGTNPIYLPDIKKCLDFFKGKAKYRAYLLLLSLGLRPAEPMQLTWNNFVNGQLIFRPHKQLKRNVLRKIKIPPRMWEELTDFKEKNFFSRGKLFDFTHESFRRRFNGEFRKFLGTPWNEHSENYRGGKIAVYHRYTLSCFRTTMATLIYHYYSQVYGHGDLALTLACKYMGHSAEKMTAEYYIKRVDRLGLDKFPKLPLLQLWDHLIYNESQNNLDKYINSERQALFIEY